MKQLIEKDFVVSLKLILLYWGNNMTTTSRFKVKWLSALESGVIVLIYIYTSVGVSVQKITFQLLKLKELYGTSPVQILLYIQQFIPPEDEENYKLYYTKWTKSGPAVHEHLAIC